MSNRVAFSGFDTQAKETDGVAVLSGLAYETTIVRSGAGSLKMAAISGTNGAGVLAITPGTFIRVYVRVTARPATTGRIIWGTTAASTVNLTLNANGTIKYAVGATSFTSTTALTDTTKWYRIEFRAGTGTNVSLLLIDGNVEVTGSPSSWVQSSSFGSGDAVADTYTLYFDDYASDNTDFPGVGVVIPLLPVSDNSVGTGWTTSDASSLNLWDCVNNTPPTGIADTTASAGHQIRNASSATASYVANLKKYSDAGIGANDIINAVQSFVVHAAPVSTGAKTGSQQLTANPAAGSATAFTHGTGGTADYWTGTAAGTYPTGWVSGDIDRSAIINDPTIVVTNNPTLSLNITGGTASRIAMCCAMGMYVDYTPSVPKSQTPVASTVTLRPQFYKPRIRRI